MTLWFALAATAGEVHDGLVWTWTPETSRSWWITADVTMPRWLDLAGGKTGATRLRSFIADVTTTCRLGEESTKKTFDVRCTIDGFALQARAVDAEVGRAGPLVVEAANAMAGATVTLLMSPSGRVKSVDVDGLSSDSERSQHQAESLSLIAGRVFAALDFQLPQSGSDGGGQWAIGLPQAMRTMSPSSSGTVNGVASVTGVDGVRWIIETVAKGSVTDNSSVENSGSEVGRDIYDMEMHGAATWDPQAGGLVDRKYRSDGAPTAGSAAATGVSGNPYTQIVTVRTIDPTAPISLPISGELPPN